MFASLIPGLIVLGVGILGFRLVFGFLMRPPGFKRGPRKNYGIRTRLVRGLAYIVSRIEHL
jgi:hypothetical protein